MPILPLQECVFPPELFDCPQPSTAGEGLWWVLHTKPRQEKRLAHEMIDKEIPFYLPLIRKRNLVRGRVVYSHIPLFAGYFFLLAGQRERIAALATKRVVNCLAVHDQERLFNDLFQINRLIASGASVTPEDRLQPGSTVEIRHGPLT